jgi:hypothetical protein
MPDLAELPSLVPRELGVDFVWSGHGANWPAFLKQIDVCDLLDLITLTYRFLTAKKRFGMRNPSANERWVAEMRRIFEEENFGYTVDDAGGVHYRLDEEFARNLLGLLPRCSPKMRRDGSQSCSNFYANKKPRQSPGPSEGALTGARV